MKMKPFFKEERVAEVADAIASALRPHIANEYESTVDEASAATNAFNAGLTIGETHVALIRALAILQNEQTVKLTGLLITDYDDEDADEVAV